jgi:hypothetical protein
MNGGSIIIKLLELWIRFFKKTSYGIVVQL